MARDQGGKYTLVAEDETLGTRRRLGKRMAAVVTIALCCAAAIVLFSASGLPTTTLEPKKPKRVVVIADRLTPLTEEGKGFVLKTYPPFVEDGGDLVISWEGDAATPLSSRDYVTLSCGPTTGEGDYLMKKGVKDTDATDHSVRFSELYMMRCNYTAVYFNYEETSGKFKAIAMVEAGMKEPFETPKHGHLSLTDDYTAMAILFNSGTSDTPMVKYGENPQDLKFHATGTSTTYRADDL